MARKKSDPQNIVIRKPIGEELSQIKLAIGTTSVEVKNVKATVEEVKTEVKSMSKGLIETVIDHGNRIKNLEDTMKIIRNVVVGIVIAVAAEIILQLIMRMMNW